MEKTQIEVTKSTREKLKSIKKYVRESYNEIINRLINGKKKLE